MHILCGLRLWAARRCLSQLWRKFCFATNSARIRAGELSGIYGEGPEKVKPYRPRPIKFQGVVALGEWRLKLYTLHPIEIPDVPINFLESVLPVLQDQLCAPRAPFEVAGTDWNHLENYKVGFAMVHIGAKAVFLLCDYWVGENMLNHSVWVSSLNGEPEWQPIGTSGTSVCLWELAVQAHEREAWINHVYNAVAEPDFEAYLADTLTATL